VDVDEDDDKRFDLALGISDYLGSFAAHFTEPPALHWDDWPVEVEGRNAIATYKNIKAFMFGWSETYPDGRIKFNLTGVETTDKLGNLRGSTLMELRLIIDIQPDRYLERTDFYFYDGVTFQEVQRSDAIAYVDANLRSSFRSLPNE
jgi:hypothetical protein